HVWNRPPLPKASPAPMNSSSMGGRVPRHRASRPGGLQPAASRATTSLPRGGAALRQATPRGRDDRMTEALGVKALTFDVFGTVVDWRSSIIREGRELGRAKGL